MLHSGSPPLTHANLLPRSLAGGEGWHRCLIWISAPLMLFSIKQNQWPSKVLTMTFKAPTIPQHDPFSPFFQTAEAPHPQCSDLCMVFQLHWPSACLLNTLQERLPPISDSVHYEWLRQFPHSFGSCSLFSVRPALQSSLLSFYWVLTIITYFLILHVYSFFLSLPQQRIGHCCDLSSCWGLNTYVRDTHYSFIRSF